MRYRLRRYIALIIVVALIGTIYFLPFTFPFTFRSNSLIYPSKIWNLRSDTDGNFYGEIKNYRTGVVETSISYRFERGDITNLQVNEKINQNPIIQKGDTLGLLSSRLIDERIEQLENLIAVDERLLQSSRAGEKEEIVINLQQKLLLAGRQFDLALKKYERMKTLYDEKVVAPDAFESAENDYQIAQTNVEIARSDYEIAQTGLKPEALLVIEERITRYKREIDFLKETQKQYLILSPLSGKLIANQFSQTQYDYISISDTSEYILYAAVKYSYLPYLNDKMFVSFALQSTDEAIEAEIFDISDRVEHFFGNQIVFVKAKVLSSNGAALTGLSVQAKFHGEPVTLREFIRRTIEIFIR
jgi:hypothetical protein